MKLAYFDCPSGASGDMILGALVDAGVPFEALGRELGRLRLPGYRLERREVLKGAFRATKVEVVVGEPADHHGAGHHPEHPHRTLPDILAILERSTLPERVQEQASRIFRRLAQAEGRVHGVPPEEVRFHDVGAVDAIVDVTGACIGLHLLGVEEVRCSALPVGGGWVHGPHGLIPAPAPGTAELLRGFPVVDTGLQREILTPTGAAILTTLAAAGGAMPAMRVAAVGYGAGSMDLPMPNLLRLWVGEAVAEAGEGGAGEGGADEGAPGDTVLQVEATVDDMSPQLWEPLMERLFAEGALDVFLTPVIMKRSRPGVVLTALCPPPALPALARVLFEESTTIGLRWAPRQRQRLARELVTLETRYGPIPFKVSRYRGRVVTVTPEFARVDRLARERGVPVREVLDEARAVGQRWPGAAGGAGAGDPRSGPPDP